MSDTYKAKVNNSFEFEITKTDCLELDAIKPSKTTYHVLQDNTSYNAKIIGVNLAKRSYTVLVNETSYEVAITNALDHLIKKMGFEVGIAKKINHIKAPMPGLILDISVSEGQEIQENSPLLILEAMKMENSIVSPRHGVIKSISVNKGDAVDKNQLLIEFE